MNSLTKSGMLAEEPSWANSTWPMHTSSRWWILPFGTFWASTLMSQVANGSCLAFGADPLFNYVNDYLVAQPLGMGLCLWDLGAMDMACDLTRF